MRDFINIVNNSFKKSLKESVSSGKSILREFLDTSVLNVNMVVASLEHILGEKLYRVGGPSRIYDVDGGGQGAVYVVGDTMTAVGIAWPSRSVGVRSVYVWHNFSINKAPEYCISLPKVDFDDVSSTVAKLIMNPQYGQIPVNESTIKSVKNKLNEAARVSVGEFIGMANKWAAEKGKDASKLTLADLQQIAHDNETFVPGEVRSRKDLKNPNSPRGLPWFNLSGAGSMGGGSVDSATVNTAISNLLGSEISPSMPEDGEYDDVFDTAANLAKAKLAIKMVSQGKLYVTGRKNGKFFRLPPELFGQLVAQVERLYARELADSDPEHEGKSSMEVQYEDLADKVRLVAGGKSNFVKSLLITGAPSSGKCLALDTPIPTPDGWITMGEIKEGDKVFDENGDICDVVSTSEIFHNHDCYEIEFNDRTKIIANADHLWHTTTSASRQSERRNKKSLLTRIVDGFNDQQYKRKFPGLVSTKTISETLLTKSGKDFKYNHKINNCSPILRQKNDDNLIINPYVLGIWLGDGCHSNAQVSCGNMDKNQLCELLEGENEKFTIIPQKDKWVINLTNGDKKHTSDKFFRKVKELNLYKNKHIPQVYLRSSYESRLALLQGLMDSDGYISNTNECEFVSIRKDLADQTLELITSLGIKAVLSEGESKLYGVVKGPKYRIHFTTSLPVFRFERKLAKIKLSYQKPVTSRAIVRCDKIDSVPVKCITVNSKSSLFLCSKAFIPTHNSFNVMNIIKKELGLIEGDDYIVKKGYITTNAMFRVLIEQCNNGLAIFDDCDSVVGDKRGINMLKGALDTDAVREISNDKTRGTVNTAVMKQDVRDEYVYKLSELLRGKKPTPEDAAFFAPYVPARALKQSKAEREADEERAAGRAGNDDEEKEESQEIEYFDDLSGKENRIIEYVMINLPNKIDFKGRIIFISNMNEDEWDSAILSRAFFVNLNFESGEMLDFIDKIKENIITPGVSEEKKQEVIDYIRELHAIGKIRQQINFRLVQQAFDYALIPNWQRLVKQL